MKPYLNTLTHGDCTTVMQSLPNTSIDLIITDPPYLVNYRDRTNRTLIGDRNSNWVQPAFNEMYRLLRQHRFCISFYGWHKVDLFMQAWRNAGFQPVGHFVFHKHYTSKRGFTSAQHESAFLLAKGNPDFPKNAPADVLPWGKYTRNAYHPTQKPIEPLRTLINAFSQIGDVVMDPFAGSGTTCLAARQLRRSFIGIEKDKGYYQNAVKRLA